MYNEPKFILHEVFAMPKIIDNLEEKIHDSAFKLFSERDYGSVSMKTVAEDVGIAVGTVYNYHSNKKELFLSVLKHNIDQIYLNLNELIEEDCNLFEFITAFYDEITRIGGFSEEILRNNIRNEDIEELTVYIDQILRKLIFKMNEKKGCGLSKKAEDRLIEMLLLITIEFAKRFPGERKENIAFINNLVAKIAY